MIKNLVTLLVSVIATQTFAATDLSAHNPNFVRMLKNPKTYVYNKKFSFPESICGTNELVHVADYAGQKTQPVEFVAKHETAVAALAYGEASQLRKYCTGTMISENLFITAAHCIDTDILKEFAVFNYQRLPNNGGMAVEEPFKILEVVEKALGGLDFAILKLDGAPGAKYGFTKINVNEVENGHLLTIIQHPSGNPKMVDIGNRNGTRGENYMTYGNLDTEPGSSGSGVLNAEGELVGIHTNGGCIASAGANAGVMMTLIARSSPTIREMTRSSEPVPAPTPDVPTNPAPVEPPTQNP